MFFIGLQVGPSFSHRLKSGGLRLNLLTLLTVILSLVVTIVLSFVFKAKVLVGDYARRLFRAVTNTPGLGATQEALKMMEYTGEDIAVAYACAYPLAVVAIIATAIVLRIVFRIDLKEEDRQWEEAPEGQ